MGLVQPRPNKPFTFAAGRAAVGDQVNKVFDVLYSLLNGGVGDPHIADNADIAGTKIADGSIPTAKLADGAVATAKIADNAVTTAKIPDDAVTAQKIAPGAVGTSELALTAVTFGNLKAFQGTASYPGVFSLALNVYQPFLSVNIPTSAAGFVIASYGMRIDTKNFAPSYRVLVELEANDATTAGVNGNGSVIDFAQVVKDSPGGQYGGNAFVGSTYVGAVGATGNGSNRVFRLIVQSLAVAGTEATDGKLQVLFIPNA